MKLADKLYNLQDLERSTPVGWSQQRKQEYFVWAAKVLTELAEFRHQHRINCFQVVLGLRGSNEQMETLLDQVFQRNGVEDPRNIKLSENEINE